MRITRSVIPNLFTLANLFSGFTAIVYISDDKMYDAALFILLAGIFDALDGVVARLTKSTSELGVELDSLCDAVSFGVAPSFMLYKLYFQPIGDIGLLLASLPALAGIYRLARFNAELTGYADKQYFTGMPIPAGAISLLSYAVFFEPSKLLPLNLNPALYYFVTIIVSLAMISRVQFENMPRFTPKSLRQRPLFSIMIVAAIIAAIITKGIAIFPAMMLYLIAGFIRHIFRIVRSNMDDDIEED